MELETRFWKYVRKTDDCWLWTGTHSTGRWPYGHIRRSASEGSLQMQAHRASWEIHHGPVPDGLWVLHKCDVTLCVRPDHLFLGTAKTNSEDMVSKQRDKFWGGPENKRRGRPPNPKVYRQCKHCGFMFTVKPKHPDVECCSNACAQAARVHTPLSRESLASYREKRGWGPKKLERNCPVCGAYFTVDANHKDQVYCDRGCSNGAKAHKPLSPEALESFRRKRGFRLP